MYCNNCGTKQEKNGNYCTKCGHLINTTIPNQQINSTNNPTSNNIDLGNNELYLIGAIFPLIGFILGLIWINKKPTRSKQILLGCGIFIFLLCYIFLKNVYAQIISLLILIFIVYKAVKAINKERNKSIESYSKANNLDYISITNTIKESDRNSLIFVIAILFVIISLSLIIVPIIIYLGSVISEILLWIMLVILTLGLYLSSGSPDIPEFNQENYNIFIALAIICFIISIVIFFIYFKKKKKINSNIHALLKFNI